MSPIFFSCANLQVLEHLLKGLEPKMPLFFFSFSCKGPQVCWHLAEWGSGLMSVGFDDFSLGPSSLAPTALALCSSCSLDLPYFKVFSLRTANYQGSSSLLGTRHHSDAHSCVQLLGHAHWPMPVWCNPPLKR